jgi:muramoyltetrapeptide carboxypeptidase
MTLLRTGDTVAVVAASAQLPGRHRHLHQAGVELLESWGLDVRDEVTRRNHFYLAGPDRERSQSLRRALLDPEVRGVFFLRGGYGSARTLRHLRDLEGPVEKTLVGFSDVTCVHMAAAVQWPATTSIYGPNLATPQLLDASPEAAQNREVLRSVLFEDGAWTGSVEFLRGGNATARVIGGCLTSLVSLVGTPWFPDLRGGILFLEDAGEAPYRIDRMLTQLRDCGALQELAGLVFGSLHRCVDRYNDPREVVMDAIGDGDYPVAFGLPTGHGPINLALRLNAEYRLDSERGHLSVA